MRRFAAPGRADPAIRDFVGLAENEWDFNDPNADAGFGPITPEEVARLLTAERHVDRTRRPPPEPAQVATLDDKSAGRERAARRRDRDTGGGTGARLNRRRRRNRPQRNMVTAMMLRRKKMPDV